MTLIPKTDKCITRKLQTNIFHKQKCKSPQQSITKLNKITEKKIIYHAQVGFISDM